MIVFLRIRLLQFRSRTRYPGTHFCILQNQSMNSFSTISDSATPSSLTLNYLINSCGLSPEAAILASTKVTLKNTSAPDSVLEFFKKHKFNKTQISHIISFRPKFLLSRVHLLEPKIKIFQDFGISGSNLTDFVAVNPHVLTRGHKTTILPALKFMKDFIHTNENLLKAWKRSIWLLPSDPQKVLQPNIAILRKFGVPESRIEHIIITRPVLLFLKPACLTKWIKEVEDLGFEPGSGMFVLALQAMSRLSKSKWDAKFQLLKGLGWSEEEILHGFRRMPIFLTYSEDKIKNGMDFLVNSLKWTPCFISSNPRLLMYSTKKRLIPRSRVWWILSSKDVIKGGKEELVRMFNLTENAFLNRYVNKYEDVVPYLLKIYKGELDVGWMDSKLSRAKV